MAYKNKARSKTFLTLPRRVWVALFVLILVCLIAVFGTRYIYNNDLNSVNISENTQVFTVASGNSVKQISENLQKAGLIRSAWAFELYVHSKELSAKMQAGTYAFSPSQNTPKIVSILTSGKVSSKEVTIVPGQRVDQIKADFINDGFSPADVNSAFNNLGQYSDLPVMAFKPANVTTLEGLLWPDTWEKNSDTPPSYIIRESLTEMGQHLTSDVQSSFVNEGLDVYQGITMTSIVEQEVNKPADEAQAAQVFLTRYKAGTMLGSDATARYGAVIAGKTPSVTYDSDYNTRLYTGLPPTPISTINEASLFATTHPANTSWLFFVTGDDGTTYFSNTLQQQQANTQQYCHKLCSSE